MPQNASYFSFTDKVSINARDGPKRVSNKSNWRVAQCSPAGCRAKHCCCKSLREGDGSSGLSEPGEGGIRNWRIGRRGCSLRHWQASGSVSDDGRFVRIAGRCAKIRLRALLYGSGRLQLGEQSAWLVARFCSKPGRSGQRHSSHDEYRNATQRHLRLYIRPERPYGRAWNPGFQDNQT
jgi:hypothetical protein